jgi:beta-glucanase (GH16 family)
MKNARIIIPLCLALAACAGPASTEASSSSPILEPSTPSSQVTSDSSEEPPVLEDYHPDGYSLTWSDEFEGDSLSADQWTYEIGNNNGWGNHERQYYTDHNETVGDGLLTIHAKREDTTEVIRDQSVTFPYTSSRLVSRHKAFFTYGYMCARIRLPLGQGMWPAFWMMPETNYGTEGVFWWPTCGEIDIMEAKGRFPNVASGAIHYSSDGTGGHHTFQTRENQNFGSIDEFHVYAVEWTNEKITWIYDGIPFFTAVSATWNYGYQTGDDAPFNRDFYFILNLAVGGDFDGGREPDENFQEAGMDVDYVRCYQLQD